MADSKISALTALTGANVATDDLIHIIDTSATENKKITIDEFLQALPSDWAFITLESDQSTPGDGDHVEFDTITQYSNSGITVSSGDITLPVGKKYKVKFNICFNDVATVYYGTVTIKNSAETVQYGKKGRFWNTAGTEAGETPASAVIDTTSGAITIRAVITSSETMEDIYSAYSYCWVRELAV